MMKYTLQLLVVFFLILAPSSVFTQDDGVIKSKYRNVERFETAGNYQSAVLILKELVSLSPGNANFNFKLAINLIESNADEDPLKYLEIAAKNVITKYVSSYDQPGTPPLVLKYLAIEQMRHNQFQEAFATLEKYRSFIPAKDKGTQKSISMNLEYCLSGIELVKKPIRIRNLELGVNFVENCTAHSPVFSPDESIYIFASKSKSTTTQSNSFDNDLTNDDLFYTYYDGKRWSDPLPVANVNTMADEAPLSITPDGKQLLIYRYDNGDGNLYYCDLLDNNVWSKPKKFPSPINSSMQETSATMSADGTKIYFTSDRDGGKGGLDIYVSSKGKNGKWGKAVNLVQINSPFNEESPHLQANSNILYFSSDQPRSMGGLDVFRSNLYQDSIAQDIRNIGFPINSSSNEMFFKTSMDGKRAYYSTSCRTKKGALDLRMIELVDEKLLPGVIVKGLVMNKSRDTIKGINVMLFDIANREIIDSTRSNEKTGYYSFKLNQERKYFTSFEYNNYVYFTRPFNIQKYFSNLTYSNLITLESVVISDTSFRQSTSDFIVYSNKLKNKQISNDLIEKTKNLPMSELIQTPPSVLDLVSYVERQVSNKISRLSNKVFIAKDLYKPIQQPLDAPLVTSQPVVLSKIEPEKIDSTAKVGGVLVIDHKRVADSLLRIGIGQYNDTQYVSCIEAIGKAQNIYELINDKADQFVCLNYIANAMYMMGRMHEALGVNRQALAIARELKSKVMEGEKLENIGDIYAMMNDKTNALENYYPSLSIHKELADKPGELRLLNSIANLLYNQNDFDKSIKYLQEVLERNKGNEKAMAELYNRIGLSYHGKHDYDSAIANFEKAIAISDRIGDKKNASIYLNNQGNSYYELLQLNKALDIYKRSLALKQEINFEEGMAITYHNIGNVMRKQMKLHDAIVNYSSSEKIAKKYNLNELRSKNHFGMMQVYKEVGNYKMALNHYKIYADLRMPNLNQEGQLQISQDLVKYEVNDKDIARIKRNLRVQEMLWMKEEEKTKSEINYLKSREQRQKVLQSIFAAGIIAMIIVLVLAGYRYITKRKSYKQLALKNAEISQKNEEITTLKDNLSELNELLAKLSIVASQTSNGVAIFDGNGNYEWINKGYTDMFGYTISEVNKHKSDNLYNDIADNETRSAIKESISAGKSISFDIKKPVKKSSAIWVSVSMTPIYNGQELYKIISIESDINYVKLSEIQIQNQKIEIEQQRDEIARQHDVELAQKDLIQAQKEKIEATINELKSTQKKLVESEKMASLGNLVAGVAHEINTPIGVGIAAITTLSTRTMDIHRLFEEKKMKQTDLVSYLQTAKESARLIQANLDRTGDLVKSFKRISVDEITEQIRTFNVGQYVQDIVKSLEPKINEKEVSVKIICPETLEITSYPGVYAQIITNLITNTILHGFKNKAGGAITIECVKEKEMLRLRYVDDGNGMTPEVVEKVFNPFFTTNMQTGNGLGMNIVYNIVTQKLQGDIICKSELGKGVEFVVECPLVIKDKQQKSVS